MMYHPSDSAAPLSTVVFKSCRLGGCQHLIAPLTGGTKVNIRRRAYPCV